MNTFGLMIEFGSYALDEIDLASLHVSHSRGASTTWWQQSTSSGTFSVSGGPRFLLPSPANPARGRRPWPRCMHTLPCATCAPCLRLSLSLVEQLVCAISLEAHYDLDLYSHLLLELHTGPCGAWHAVVALTDESAQRVEALTRPE